MPVKFGLKIPNYLDKMSENASVRFCAHDVNWVVALNIHLYFTKHGSTKLKK